MEASPQEKFSVTAPPVFGSVQTLGEGPSKNSILSLDDIFDEFVFSNDRPQVRSSGQTDKKGSEICDNNYKDDEGYYSMDDDDDDNDEDGENRNKKRTRGLHSNMTEEQKVERRYSWRGPSHSELLFNTY